MVADSIVVAVLIVHFVARNAFANRYGFHHRTVRKTTAACVIDFTLTRICVKSVEHLNQIVAVNIIADLLAFVAENCVLLARYATFHQIRQKAVQFCARVIRPRQATTSENARIHAKIFAVFLNHYISRHFRRPKDGVFTVVNAHVFVNAVGEIRVRFVDFPPRF